MFRLTELGTGVAVLLKDAADTIPSEPVSEDKISEMYTIYVKR